jgi:hypothetical protein
MKGIKIVGAKQANITNRFLNMKRKLLITNANIWFNKQALIRKVTPKYVKVKVSGNSLQAKKTQKIAEYIRIKNELKFLYKKKQSINNQLYSVHLEAVALWDRSWNFIEESIQEKLIFEIDKKYLILNKKLNNLNKTHNSPQESEHKTTFSQRVKNLSSVNFNSNEIRLLSKGLQYNLTYKNTYQWLENLVIETEAAITRLPNQDQEGLNILLNKILTNLSTKRKV